MANLDLQIKGGGRSSRPLDKGEPGLKTFFQFSLEIGGTGSPGSATGLWLILLQLEAHRVF